MDERNEVGQGQYGQRAPGGYLAYLRSRGRLALPRSTAYRINRRNRIAANNRNDEPDNNQPLLNAGPANPGEAVELEHPALNEDEVLNEPVEGEPVEHNEMLADVLHAYEEPLEENNEVPALTVGPKHIERDENLEENIGPNLRHSKFETLLLIFNFALRHGLTAVAVEDLCRMINIILGGNIIPASRYMFKKTFSSDMHYQFHMFCSDCLTYIGVINEALKRQKSVPCPICRKVCKVPGLNGKNFFVTLPLKEQIAELLQNMDDVMDHLEYRWNRDNGDNIEDVYDGEIYKDLCKDGNFLSHRYNLSLTFSTDGANVFSSGCTSLWPIFFRLNELKPHCRYDECNTMIAGLWFGSKEPSMPVYFRNFLMECRDLYDNGICWQPKNSDRIIRSRIIALNCVLDSVAKPMLQFTKQFNGGNSCPYCDHPGVTYGDNPMSKWPMRERDIALTPELEFFYYVDKYNKQGQLSIFQVSDRDNEKLRADMDVADTLRLQINTFDGYKGLKGKSPMCYLPFFDVCTGFQIDYMHAVLLGTVRHVASMWFDSSYHELDFSVRNSLAEIDKRLLSMTPPSSISRRPRSLNMRCDWHANEWRSWLLFYSLPCLKGILPARYLKHHCILVSAVHILLKDKMTRAELDSVAWELGQYVKEFQNLYGAEEMFFNVHLLLHLGKSVLMWGPLFCFSMFSWESANNGVIKLVKGTTGVSSQIVSKYAVCRYLPYLLAAYDIHDDVLKYCSHLTSYSRFSHSLQCGETTLVGNQAFIELTDEERQAFQNSGLPPTGGFYERMLRKKNLFHARYYSRQGEKSDDSIARLTDGTYGAIIRIVIRMDREVVVLLRRICVNNGYITYHPCGSKAKHIKACRPIVYGNLFFATVAEIEAKAMLLTCDQDNYIADFPNIIEKD